jgi:hypothetical protein
MTTEQPIRDTLATFLALRAGARVSVARGDGASAATSGAVAPPAAPRARAQGA